VSGPKPKTDRCIHAQTFSFSMSACSEFVGQGRSHQRRLDNLPNRRHQNMESFTKRLGKSRSKVTVQFTWPSSFDCRPTNTNGSKDDDQWSLLDFNGMQYLDWIETTPMQTINFPSLEVKRGGRSLLRSLNEMLPCTNHLATWLRYWRDPDDTME
jgi:hypothetical protein